MLFNIYIDEFYKLLIQYGYGCHVVIIICVTWTMQMTWRLSLRHGKILNVWLLVVNSSPLTLIKKNHHVIMLDVQTKSPLKDKILKDEDQRLKMSFSTKDQINCRRTTQIIQNLCCSSNSILNNFSILHSNDVRKIYYTFCMSVYSSELL